MISTELLGQLSCLAAAALWALAVTLFRRPISLHGATLVNLAKCLVATALLVVTALATGGVGEVGEAPLRDLVLLVLSGLFGMTLGDTALFAAVSRVGVHRALLVQTLAPVFAAGMAAAVTAETLSTGELGGGVVILVGVALVVAPQRGTSSAPEQGATVVAGVAFGLLSAFGQGTGVVLAKQGMSSLAVLPATTFRLAAATLGLAMLVGARGKLGDALAICRDRRSLGRILPASVLGTYVAMLLMMAGIALAPASVAAVLLATSPVFSLVIEAALTHRAPSLKGTLGTALAVIGVAILTTWG